MCLRFDWLTEQTNEVSFDMNDGYDNRQSGLRVTLLYSVTISRQDCLGPAIFVSCPQFVSAFIVSACLCPESDPHYYKVLHHDHTQIHGQTTTGRRSIRNFRLMIIISIENAYYSISLRVWRDLCRGLSADREDNLLCHNLLSIQQSQKEFHHDAVAWPNFSLVHILPFGKNDNHQC